MVHTVPHILYALEDICNFSDLRYIFGPKVYIANYVLGGLEDICNFLDLQVYNTRCALCFGWIRRYLQLFGSQVHIVPHVLGRLGSTCNSQGS